MTTPPASLYVGCAIWAHKGWVGNFYPEKTKPADFLREYSRRLNTVEGNTTFYAIPSAATVARWAEQMSAGFQFCPKLPKLITHEKRLKDVTMDTHFFVERLSGLGDKLGPFFVQLPPSFSPAAFDTLAEYLALFESPQRVCVEVRHDAWFTPENRLRLNALLQQHNAAKVVIDTRGLREGTSDDVLVNRSRERKPDVPVQPDLTADFAFVRLICNPVAELNEPYFAEWLPRLVNWLRGGTTVFLYTHCPDEVHSPVFARELHRRIAPQVEVAPYVPLRGCASELQQGALL